MEKREIPKNKGLLITIFTFLFVVALGAVVFGIEYTAVVKTNKDLNSKISRVTSERDSVASKNAVTQQELDSTVKTASDLKQKVNDLNSEISRIQLTRANASKSSSKPPVAVSKPNNSGSANPVNTANLNAPNVGSKVCYLTFDDGPSNNTLRILDILKQANAKATFFVLGNGKLEYVKKEIEQGHTVALHSDTHNWNIYASETAYFNDLDAVNAKVKKFTGTDTSIIRFPGGSSNTKSKKYCKGIMTRLTKKVTEKGYTYVDWNVDSGDASANGVPVNKLVNNVISQSRGKDSICVLMHDTGAKNTTVDALPQIICYLRSQGYRFEALTKESKVFHHGVNN